jgi:hypothetical protein
MLIFPNTPPDVARAQISDWQRKKELRFLAELQKLIRKHLGKGLEKRRMIRVIAMLAKGLPGVGG